MRTTHFDSLAKITTFAPHLCFQIAGSVFKAKILVLFCVLLSTVAVNSKVLAAVPSADSGDGESGAAFEELLSLSGPWYDPLASGDGFNIMAFERPGENPALVFFFYGYNSNGNRMWLVSKVVSPDNLGLIENIPMRYPYGSGFQGAGDHSLELFGELDFEFTGCGTGRFTLRNGEEIFRTWDAVQLADIPGPGCLLGDDPRNYQTISGVSGNWFIPAESGDGLNLVMTDHGLAGYFYGYDQNGEPLWLLTNLYKGPIIPGREITVNVRQGTGGNLSDASNAELEIWGTMTLLFKDCDSAIASFEGLDGTRSMSLEQLVKIAGTTCEPPGTIELNKPTLTFEGIGTSSQVDFVVKDGYDAQGTPDNVRYSFADDGIVAVHSESSGTVTFEALTNQVTDTRIHFWDPVYNAIQEISVANVELQPGVVFVHAEFVQNWVTPLSGEIKEVVLASNAVTDGLAPGSFIVSEGGLFGKIESRTINGGQVSLQISHASILDIYLNLSINLESLESSSTLSSTPTYSSRLQSSGKSFSSPELEPVLPSCNLNNGSVIGDVAGMFKFDPRFDLAGVEPDLGLKLEIRDGEFVEDQAYLALSMRVLGQLEIAFQEGAHLQAGVDCGFDLPPIRPAFLPTHIGVFVPKLSWSPGFKFLLEAVPIDPLVWDIGVLARFGIDFADNGSPFASLEGGLASGEFADLSQYSLENASWDMSFEFEPYFGGALGIEYWTLSPPTPIVTSDFLHADISLPYTYNWEFLSNPNHPDYRGIQHSLSLSASVTTQGIIDPEFLELLDTTPVPVTPGLPLAGPLDYLLFETPRISASELDCGNNCSVGDARSIVFDIWQGGLLNSKVYGDAHLIENPDSPNLFASHILSRDTPESVTFVFTPDVAGEHIIMPRFESYLHGVIYGGPPLAIQVDGGTATVQYQLNDTGIDWAGDYPSGNNATCIGETIAAQDCSHGRDSTHDDDLDGHAGFSFTKLDANGNDLPAAASVWSCVRDEVTGLTWETKTDDGGLQDADNTYSWYNPDPSTNGGNPGTQNGGACSGSGCDTHGYVQAVNAKAQALCGARDWRMPWLEELRSIVDYSRILPSIDTAYFPLQRNSYVWSGSPGAYDSGYAWDIYFSKGTSYTDARHYGSRVRLVRGGQ